MTEYVTGLKTEYVSVDELFGYVFGTGERFDDYLDTKLRELIERGALQPVVKITGNFFARIPSRAVGDVPCVIQQAKTSNYYPVSCDHIDVNKIGTGQEQDITGVVIDGEYCPILDPQSAAISLVFKALEFKDSKFSHAIDFRFTKESASKYMRTADYKNVVNILGTDKGVLLNPVRAYAEKIGCDDTEAHELIMSLLDNVLIQATLITGIKTKLTHKDKFNTGDLISELKEIGGMKGQPAEQFQKLLKTIIMNKG